MYLQIYLYITFVLFLRFCIYFLENVNTGGWKNTFVCSGNIGWILLIRIFFFRMRFNKWKVSLQLCTARLVLFVCRIWRSDRPSTKLITFYDVVYLLGVASFQSVNRNKIHKRMLWYPALSYIIMFNLLVRV